MSERAAASGPFPGRLALQQRVLPTYRLPFFEALAASCQGGLTVFAGQPAAGESITSLDPLSGAQTAPNLSLNFTTNRQWRTPSSPFYLCWQAGLLKWLAQEEPDTLIVEANPRIRSTPAAIRWMRVRQRPVLGWGLGAPVPHGPLAGLRGHGWPRFLSQFDALIAYSPLGAEQYRLQGFPAERIFVAPNAVTPRPSAPLPPRPVGAGSVGAGERKGGQKPPEHASGPAPTAPTVLFVGRLQARKRIEDLLRAAAALPAAIQPRLQVVGDGPVRPALQALAQEIYPSAEFPGERTGPDLEPYFAAADLFVLPGTGGLAVQQAMAHGLPVIAAQGDGTLDALIRPANGWRVPPSDLPALTAVLQTALTDIPRLRRMGAESYRIVSEEVNLEEMVNAFLHALTMGAPEPEKARK
jgi:glycosyltransferase involved in cell wall biosynthesis